MDEYQRPAQQSKGNSINKKIIKLKNYNLPIRLDEFIKIHLDFLHGKLKIVDAEENGMFSKNEFSISTCMNKKEEIQSVETAQQALKCPVCINNDRPSAHVRLCNLSNTCSCITRMLNSL